MLLDVRTTPDAIAIAVRQDIVRGVISENGQLTEKHLTEQFDVSRASVRTALQTLSRWHLVKLAPGKGAALIALDKAYALDVCETWLLLLRGLCTHGVPDRFKPELRKRLADYELTTASTDVPYFFRDTNGIMMALISRTEKPILGSLLKNLLPALQRCLYFYLQERPESLAEIRQFVSVLGTYLVNADESAAAACVDQFAHGQLAAIETVFEDGD